MNGLNGTFRNTIVECLLCAGIKHLVHGDILIDDCIGNFTLDHTKDSPVKYNFIFDKPWNRSVQEDNTKNFRVHGWDEIYELIDKLEDF